MRLVDNRSPRRPDPGYGRGGRPVPHPELAPRIIRALCPQCRIRHAMNVPCPNGTR